MFVYMILLFYQNHYTQNHLQYLVLNKLPYHCYSYKHFHTNYHTL